MRCSTQTQIHQSSTKVRLITSPLDTFNDKDNEWYGWAIIIWSCNYRLGISEPLTFSEVRDLLKFISIEFKDFNVTEFEHAVTLYCSKKLPEIDYSTDKHYNKFSHVFLGLILDAYRKYRSKQQILDEKAKKKPLLEYDKSHERLMWYTKYIFLPYEELKEGRNTFNDGNLNFFYKEMNPLGLFKDYVKDGSYKDFMIQAKELTPQKEETNLRIRIFENRTHERPEDWEFRCKKVARCLLVMDWLQNKVMEAVDIREIIIPLIKKA